MLSFHTFNSYSRFLSLSQVCALYCCFNVGFEGYTFRDRECSTMFRVRKHFNRSGIRETKQKDHVNLGRTILLFTFDFFYSICCRYIERHWIRYEILSLKCLLFACPEYGEICAIFLYLSLRPISRPIECHSYAYSLEMHRCIKQLDVACMQPVQHMCIVIDNNERIEPSRSRIAGRKMSMAWFRNSENEVQNGTKHRTD